MKKRRFKQLSLDNWLTRDPTGQHIVAFAADGSTKALSELDWAEAFLAIELADDVPAEVRDLFEVAQGALCYGAFFYPLYTFAAEQFYRVLDAAVAHKCLQSGAPKSRGTFQERLAWLVQQSAISAPRFEQWNAARELRNSASHATKQSVYDPTMALATAQRAAEFINELFSERSEGELERAP